MITETYADYTGLRFLGSCIDILEATAWPQHFDATIPGEQTQISFKIDDVARVSVRILKAGSHIRWIIQNLMLPAGSHSESFLIWDGNDDDNKVCLPGTYTVRITATDAYDNTTTKNVSIIIEGTQVSGTLSPNEHWIEEGEPYVLTGDVQLAYNGQLTIEPGVKVMPTGDYRIKTLPDHGLGL